MQDCFDNLLEKKIIKSDSLYIYSDCGLHFRNKENIQYFYQLRKRLNIKIFINYFIEGHGKNIVDAQFRVLSSFIKDIRKKSGNKGVFTIEELILKLEEKKNQNEKYKNINYIKIDIKKKSQKSNFEIANFLDFYYFELSGENVLAKILSNNINYKIFHYNEKIIEKKEKERNVTKKIYIKENLSKRKENKFKRNKNENIYSIKDILKSKKKNDLINLSKILNIKFSKNNTKEKLANNLKDIDNIIEIVKNYEINKNDEINENKVKECDKINKENDSNETDSKLELNEINENLSKKTNFNYDPDLYLELFEDEEMKGELKDDEIENNKIMKENILDQIKNYKNLNNDNKSNKNIKDEIDLRENNVKSNKNIIDEIELKENNDNIDLRENNDNKSNKNIIDEIDLKEKEKIEIIEKNISDNQLNEIKENIKKYNFINNEINKNININNFKININNYKIEKKEIEILIKPYDWINDNIINAYLSLIQNNFKNYHYFFNNFYIKLSNNYRNYNFDGVKRYTKNVNLLEKEKIFFPININGNHWILSYIDVKNNLFYCLDPKYGEKYISEIYYNINLWYKDITKTNNDLIIKDIKFPKQSNSYDCGVFVLAFIFFLSTNRNIDYLIEDYMKFFRKKLIYCLLNENFNFFEKMNLSNLDSNKKRKINELEENNNKRKFEEMEENINKKSKRIIKKIKNDDFLVYFNLNI